MLPSHSLLRPVAVPQMLVDEVIVTSADYPGWALWGRSNGCGSDVLVVI